MRRLIIIIEAGKLNSFNGKAFDIDQTGGDKTFRVPLAQRSKPDKISHYIANWNLPDHMDERLAGKAGSSWSAGRPVADTKADFEAFLPQIRHVFDASQTTANGAMDSLGLERYITEDDL